MAIRASINRGLPSQLQSAFSDVVPVLRPSQIDYKIKDPQWLAGFTSGEGSFFIRIIASTTSSLGFIVKLVFKFGQHSREEILIKSFIDYFDCGHVTLWKNEVVFNVTKLSDIVNKIIPFYRKYGIIGGKLKDFSDWSTVAEMMLKKEHLTQEGLEQIPPV